MWQLQGKKAESHFNEERHVRLEKDVQLRRITTEYINVHGHQVIQPVPSPYVGKIYQTPTPPCRDVIVNVFFWLRHRAHHNVVLRNVAMQKGNIPF